MRTSTSLFHYARRLLCRVRPLTIHLDRSEIPLRLPNDRRRFWLTFLPEEERALRPTGIHLFGLRYWSPALSGDVGRSDRRLLVKYDPRDMARVFVRRPSLTARRTVLAKGRREVDPRIIVRTAIAQRELVDAATRKTTTARRGGGRQKSKAGDDGWGSLAGATAPAPRKIASTQMPRGKRRPTAEPFSPTDFIGIRMITAR
jgi:hypothetical protein